MGGGTTLVLPGQEWTNQWRMPKNAVMCVWLGCVCVPSLKEFFCKCGQKKMARWSDVLACKQATVGISTDWDLIDLTALDLGIFWPSLIFLYFLRNWCFYTKFYVYILYCGKSDKFVFLQDNRNRSLVVDAKSNTMLRSCQTINSAQPLRMSYPRRNLFVIIIMLIKLLKSLKLFKRK